ncbi:outer envelope pore protein 24 [Cucumis melo var. makuwa]|uniref:Outer envelope pore protein 24 n=1 Tax=Cucumis melo var. makuwa TaxID=1194695 RepID=A0A5A7SRK5_CUCMM|nr:outer envelope pore protein 24 [Cucumis melo var. makuwa]
MALEENIILPLPNEETIEIESVTKLEPVASMQKKEGKPQRKGEASLNSNKKLTREVKALLALQAYSSSGGIFILWKEESITVVDSIQDQFSISIRCKFNTSFSGWITGVYDPSSYRLTDQFWWELSGLYVTHRRSLSYSSSPIISTSKSSATSTLAINAGDVKLRASIIDVTIINGPSLNDLALSVEKLGFFIVDYNVPKKNEPFGLIYDKFGTVFLEAGVCNRLGWT